MNYVRNAVGFKHQQRGATFLGMLTIISILLFAVYGGIRLVPLYKEYMDITRAITQVASTVGSGASPAEIRAALQQRWHVDDIKSIEPKDIIITRNREITEIRAQYRAEAEFISNISLVVDFDKAVTTGGAAGP
jgi:hypothetical protein